MAIDKLSGNSFATGAIANSLGYTPANKAGDTFTGSITVNGAIKTTSAFHENATAITADYTITANSNALTAGPISIANTATVTIPSDSNWIIL